MSTYCVYITTYRGNKLPPFYIGSSTISRIERGYRGSVSSKAYEAIWKAELKAHPELFRTIPVSLHETKALAEQAEDRLQRKLQVIHNPLYINKAYALHPRFDWKGRDRGQAWRQKMSRLAKKRPFNVEAHRKGRLKCIGQKRSAETRWKMREAQKDIPKSLEHRQAIRASALKRERLECPHCQMTATAANLKRWHGDNCRQRAGSITS